MAESESERAGLPPGPWRAVIGRDGLPKSFVDASGMPVLYPHHTGERIAVSPEVVRAIEALPTLVAAARGVMRQFESSPYLGGGDGRSFAAKLALRDSSTLEVMFALRDALALVDLVDGKGGTGG